MAEVVIHKLTTPDEMEQVRHLERRVWGGEPLPVHQTITAAKNGGIVLGAFDGPVLVGFLYSFAGFYNGETYLCSHQMGIDDQYRSRGIGYQLKMAQARLAKEFGYRKIRWTYDPLESRNAVLNIHKLGAICFDYLENCYGNMSDNLNQGLASDRFWVTWNLDDTGAFRAIQPHAEFPAISQSPSWNVQSGMPVPLGKPLSFDSGEPQFVPIPRDIQGIKARSYPLASEWRTFTRNVFIDAFERGWAITDALADELVTYYVLNRRTS